MSRRHHKRRRQYDNYWFAEDYHPIRNGSIDGTDIKPHDRGLIRAMKSKFNPLRDENIRGNPYHTLFVGRLNSRTDEHTLEKAFKKFGFIRHIRVVRDIITQESKKYAFIEYDRDEAFRQAYYHMHHTIIDGAKILVDFERSRVMKGWKPRRLGGGLGGRKESGQLRFGGREMPFRRPRDDRDVDIADEVLSKYHINH